MRESIEAQQPPFRYFGKPDAAHKDAEIRYRSILEVLRRVMQQMFCIKSALGIQSKDEWEDMPKDDSIPILETYGATKPTYVPPGMTLEQVQDQWRRELRKTRPEWYQGSEDANPKWSKAFGEKLVHVSDYRNIVCRGKDPDETPEAFADRLRRCFVISDKGEKEFRKRQFFRENLQEQPSIIPTAISSLEPEQMPNELSKFHLENMFMFRHYVEQVIMQVPSAQVMGPRGFLVVPEKRVDQWEKHNVE
ncbi:MAG: hypothetical protein GY821_02265, partial [Gammaproteobacteria bacterium]|nr:hypothetical protein [Gammaproteobacteria bacterium]